MEVTEEGKIIFVKPAQPLKEDNPIEVNEVGRVKLVILLQP
jgi:hypothetical protein